MVDTLINYYTLQKIDRNPEKWRSFENQHTEPTNIYCIDAFRIAAMSQHHQTFPNQDTYQATVQTWLQLLEVEAKNLNKASLIANAKSSLALKDFFILSRYNLDIDDNVREAVGTLMMGLILANENNEHLHQWDWKEVIYSSRLNFRCCCSLPSQSSGTIVHSGCSGRAAPNLKIKRFEYRLGMCVKPQTLSRND